MRVFYVNWYPRLWEPSHLLHVSEIHGSKTRSNQLSLFRWLCTNASGNDGPIWTYQSYKSKIV